MIRAEGKVKLNPNLKQDVLEQASEKIHVPTVEHTTTVTYSSGTSTALGAAWDVMHVVYRRDDGERKSFVIARDLGGNIIRKTDVFLERWELISDPDDLRDFQHCFDERDRLTAEKSAENAS